MVKLDLGGAGPWEAIAGFLPLFLPAPLPMWLNFFAARFPNCCTSGFADHASLQKCCNERFSVICGYLWFRSLLYSRGNFGSPLLAGDCSGLCYAPLKHVGKVCTERHKHIVTKILSQSQKMLSRHIFLALNVQDLFSFRFCTDAIPSQLMSGKNALFSTVVASRQHLKPIRPVSTHGCWENAAHSRWPCRKILSFSVFDVVAALIHCSIARHCFRNLFRHKKNVCLLARMISFSLAPVIPWCWKHPPTNFRKMLWP